MPENEIMDVIATRTLEVDGHPQFHIKIGRPTLSPEGDCWFCPYEIVGPLTHRKGRFGGEDAMQALVNALYCASVEVEISAENAQGRLSWLDDREDFGLPTPPIPGLSHLILYGRVCVERRRRGDPNSTRGADI